MNNYSWHKLLTKVLEFISKIATVCKIFVTKTSSLFYHENIVFVVLKKGEFGGM